MPDITMKEGASNFIQYLTWTDRKPYTATLGNLTHDSAFGVNDPDFHHVGPGDDHRDDKIEFFAWNNEMVWSHCNAHSAAGGLFGHTVTFDFTHHSFDDAKSWDSGEITFIAWDGSHWAARIDPVAFDTADNMPLHFTLRRA